MDVGLGIAGFICVLMAFGHQTIGVVWVLPSITEENLPRTPFGSPSMSLAMVRVTWYIVTVLVAAIGVALMVLGWAPAADLRTLLLRCFAVMWLAAAVMAIWVALGRVRSLRGIFRLPIPMLWIVVSVLCWVAST
ncbi:MAG: hypothetical protein QOG54_1594 [Actinomycetota bacterium]|jgi:hypothetical protein|nr:hypothetical protein [Actinomycetota bacterium]